MVIKTLTNITLYTYNPNLCQQVELSRSPRYHYTMYNRSQSTPGYTIMRSNMILRGPGVRTRRVPRRKTP